VLPILEQPSAGELSEMQEAAKTVDADDCITWHKFCRAECCSQMSFPDAGQDLTKPTVILNGLVPPDKVRYYELHNCTYRTMRLSIPTRNARRHGGRIYILERCQYLTKENKCAHHGTNKQPRVCRELTSKNVPKAASVTSRCRFRFNEVST
jgi:hypothetical protein